MIGGLEVSCSIGSKCLAFRGKVSRQEKLKKMMRKISPTSLGKKNIRVLTALT